MTALSLRPQTAVALQEIPIVTIGEFRQTVLTAVAEGGRLAALFGRPSNNETVQLFAVLACGNTGSLAVISTEVTDAYPALTPDCAQAHWFEREIAEQWGVRPEGHPWLKPLRFHASYRPGFGVWQPTPSGERLPSVMDFFQVQGDEAHEVAVGPVHAGIIEPGHFRFQCHGEEVLHLEISLGYQHRGIERMLVGGPTKRTIHYMETLAGDTSIGHATAYCHAVEALTGCRVPVQAHVCERLRWNWNGSRIIPGISAHWRETSGIFPRRLIVGVFAVIS